MAEIKFGWKTGETLTYGAYEPDGTVRTAPPTNLPEEGATGYYHVTDAALVAGDVVVVNDGTNNVGFGEYRPEVDTVLIEGADATDTIIGTDGDTLETLSDQLDTLQSSQSQVINKYGPGE